MSKSKYEILNNLTTNPLSLSLKLFRSGLKNKKGIELYNLLLNNAHVYLELLINRNIKLAMYIDQKRLNMSSYLKILLDDYFFNKYHFDIKNNLEKTNEDYNIEQILKIFERMEDNEKELVLNMCSDNFNPELISEEILDKLFESHQEFMKDKLEDCKDTKLEEKQLLRLSNKLLSSDLNYKSSFKDSIDLNNFLRKGAL